MGNVRAFSLIELMVVIAIVGLLSAVATPAYNDYLRRVKLATAIDLVDSFGRQAVEYSESHGGSLFASVSQIGLTPDLGSPTSTLQPTTQQGYLAKYVPFVFFSSSDASPNSCAAVNVSTYLTNIDNGNEIFGVGQYAYINVNISYLTQPNGSIQRICFFTDIDNTGQSNINTTTTECYNVLSPTGGPAYGARLAELNAACP